MFYLLACSKEAKVNERGNGDPRNGIIAKLANKLEGQEKQVNPYGAISVTEVLSKFRKGIKLLTVCYATQRERRRGLECVRDINAKRQTLYEQRTHFTWG